MTQSQVGRTGRAHLRATVLAAATYVVAPGHAWAASVIDAAIKPYFVLGGLVAALVFLGIGILISRTSLSKRRMAEHAVLETGHVGLTSRIFAGLIFIGLGIASAVFAVWTASLPIR